MLEKTQKVLETIANHELFAKQDIRFVGGTALAYHINHRFSEDLDFAMLELCRDDIEATMKYFGGENILHENSVVDDATEQGGDIYDYHLKYILDGVKIEFFVPQFNLHEKQIWLSEPTKRYKNTNLKVASFETVLYMKTLAFWNRKKYRDLFDIYYVLSNIKEYSPTYFIEKYLKYNITYTKKDLYERIKSKKDFFERKDDEGINMLAANPQTYEWYRQKIEDMVYDVYLADLYK